MDQMERLGRNDDYLAKIKDGIQMKKDTCGAPKEKKLKWWQLSLLGVGCTIGTGFFLGSGLGIKLAGPAILLGFLMAAIATYLVYDALAQMTTDDPQKGSFRTYARKAFGRSAGFMNGWVYWFSEMLIMGSQLTALSLFSRFWFPQIPMWIFAAGFGVLGLGVIIIGTKGFERMENISAIVKVAAILMFIIIAILALMGVLDGREGLPGFPDTTGQFFAADWKKIWSSLVYAFFAFGGIEVIGIMSMRLEKKEDAPKAGKIMLMTLAIIYLASLSLVIMITSWEHLNTKESPFVQALDNFHLPLIPHIFNGALIIAGFSTMSASLFGITNMLITLAEDRDAPKFFSKKSGRWPIPLPAFGLTAFGLIISIILSLVMPDKVYVYFTTGAGLLILYNWLLILITYSKLMDLKFKEKMKRNLGLLLIVLAISGTLFQDDTRPGFFVSLGFVAFVGIITAIVKIKRIRKRPITRRRFRND